MNIVSSFQGQTLKCIKTFAFFEAGRTYYCIYDSGEHFYIWCQSPHIPVNEIKLSKEHKTNFRRS